MESSNLILGQNIFFVGEELPYKLVSLDKRYAICVRKLHKKHDDDLLEFEVKRGAWPTKKEAFEHHKDSPVYSILDFKEKKKAPNDRVFNPYDYFDQKDVNKCMRDLKAGNVGLSKRHGCDLKIDWLKTINKNH